MKKTQTRLAAFGLAMALLLTACGGGASAATMHLRKTEGTVGVSDSEGKDIALRENLGLYSGYQVGTQAESYAWIDLDKVKLTKMDADSEIEITKDGKGLEINVKSGSLFFNVTEPLADDETMNIRTSTMMIGIRGTCGWVTEDTAALLEGTVSVAAGDQEVTVSAGEMAVLTAEGTLEVKPFTAASVPAFVKAELEDNDTLAKEIEASSGINVLAPIDPMRLRDMYTYSKTLSYSASGELNGETEYFPDEQGRIAKRVTKPVGENNSSDNTTTYEYNDAGTLQTEIIDRAINNGVLVYYTVTEDTADHRTMVSIENGERPPHEVTYYYDAQGRLTKGVEMFNGSFVGEWTYTYDVDGKLIRRDHSKGLYDLYVYD